MRLTKTLHRTIARCEQETIERWLHSSIYELYEKQYNKLDIRQISQFLDCQYIYNDPESKPEEGAHYAIESARRRIVQLMNIQGTTDSILLNHQAAYLLLLHPTTLDPLAKLEASNLQARLNATQKFATQAPKEARWLRKITVHRALLAQEAIRSVIGIQEHLELQRATPFLLQSAYLSQAGPQWENGIRTRATTSAPTFRLATYSQHDQPRTNSLLAYLTLARQTQQLRHCKLFFTK